MEMGEEVQENSIVREGCFVIVENFAKSGETGTLIRCAVAMGSQEVCTIGYESYGKHGARGSQRYIKRSHFYDWKEFQSYLQDQYSFIPSKLASSSRARDSSPTLIPITYCGIILEFSLIQPFIDQTSSSLFLHDSVAIPVYPLKDLRFTTPHCFIVINYHHSMTKAGKSIKEIIEYYQPYCNYFAYVNLPIQSNDHYLHDDAKVSLFLQQYAIQRQLRPILFNEEEKHTMNKQDIIQKLKMKYERNSLKKGAKVMDGKGDFKQRLDLMFSSAGGEEEEEEEEQQQEELEI